MNYAVATWDETTERSYPDGISTVRAIIGARTDLPLGTNVPSSVLWSFGIAALPPGGEIEKHAHLDREELFYILEGTGRLEVGGDTIDVPAGTAVWFGVGCSHRLWNEGESDLRCLFVGLLPKGITASKSVASH